MSNPFWIQLLPTLFFRSISKNDLREARNLSVVPTSNGKMTSSINMSRLDQVNKGAGNSIVLNRQTVSFVSQEKSEFFRLTTTE